jgi:hypothetical protein
MASCICPRNELLNDLSNQACLFDWRQTSGLGFGKQGEVFTASGTDPLTDIDLLSVWQTRIAAVDDTKIQVLQNISSFEVPGAESINIAEDTNDTPQGVRIGLDETTQVATLTLRDAPMALIDELKDLACATKQLGQVGIILFNSSQVLDKGLDFIPINNMEVLSPGLGGKTDTNNTAITFNMDKQWYQNVAVTEVQFNPLNLTN